MKQHKFTHGRASMKQHKKKWREVTNRWFFLSFIICITESYLIAFSPSVSATVNCAIEDAGHCVGFPVNTTTRPSSPPALSDDGGAVGSSGGTVATSQTAADSGSGRGVAAEGTPSTPAVNQGASRIRDRFKNRLLGDEAKYQAENQRLQTEFQNKQQICNRAYPHTGHTLNCGQKLLCKQPSELQRICGSQDELLDLNKLTQLEDAAHQNIARLSQNLAGKLNMNPNEIMRSNVKDKANTTCGSAWHYANLYCKFPVRAFSGKVGNALNVIGKVAFAGQAAAGLVGKSLNDLCKAITTLSGAGVTISMLAQANCAAAMGRCRKYCNTEKHQECRSLYKETYNCNFLHDVAATKSCTNAAATGSAPVPVQSKCGQSHVKLEKHECKVKHINEMKQGCSFLRNNAVVMMKDIVQLIATVRSAKMCWDKTGGDISPPLSPDVCRQMGGTPYTDETTGEERCRFREPGEGEGVCPPYGVPVSCSQACPDTGSVPAGCPIGTCENGAVISCTNTCPSGSVPTGCGNTCPDPSLTYPNCDCNCPQGQSCNSERECTAPTSCSTDAECDTAAGEVCNNGTCTAPTSCTTDDDCDDDKVCNNGTCAAPTSCSTDADCDTGQVCNNGTCAASTSCTTDDDCDDDKVCNNGTCAAPTSCSTDADCDTGQVCNNGTCAASTSCTENSDCGPDKICHEGQCFCDCQGSPISCSEQCGGRCLEDSVNCPCQGDGECTPPQKCITNATGQNVCSDDDGEGVCPNGSRINCSEVCPDGSRPSNCRSCNGDSDCETGQICNRGTCIAEDPVLQTDGVGGGGTPTDGSLGVEDPLAIINDGMGGGDGNNNNSDGSNSTGKLPSASSGKPGKGLLARLGALLGVGKGGGSGGGFGSGRRYGSRKRNQKAKGGAKNSAAKGAGGGGFGSYGGAGGGGARNPAASTGLSAAQKKQKGNKRSAFPSNLGNIGSVHQDIFKAVTTRYKKVYNLK